MISTIPGIHHITVVASDPQQNAEFYTDVLGLRLIKRTVNFDAPGVYHLYYGDEVGTPGTALTFFPFPNAAQGKRGSGEVQSIGFSIDPDSQDYWIHRLSSKGISLDGPSARFGESVMTFLDPDGLRIDLVSRKNPPPVRPWKNSPVPGPHQVRGFSGVTMAYIDDRFSRLFLRDVMGFTEQGSEGKRTRFVVGSRPEGATVDTLVLEGITPPRQSAGSVHHIAWRVSDDPAQHAWREYLMEKGTYPTDVQERHYFRSIYFREPGGVLFEIATNGPGFLVDEDLEALGTELRLPPWYESHRTQIERGLIPLELPKPYLV